MQAASVAGESATVRTVSAIRELGREVEAGSAPLVELVEEGADFEEMFWAKVTTVNEAKRLVGLTPFADDEELLVILAQLAMSKTAA